MADHEKAGEETKEQLLTRGQPKNSTTNRNCNISPVSYTQEDGLAPKVPLLLGIVEAELTRES